MEWLTLAIIGLFGLLIGSFLNVVIVRLPKMLAHSWTTQCYEYLKQPTPLDTKKPYNLVLPRSHCPKCNHMITAADNIPVISFLFLKGRCRHCQTPISWRYPLIEITTALLSVVVAHRFGISWQSLAALILTWSLITLTVIDLQEQLLPDDITLPLIWLGLIVNSQSFFTSLESALFGAVAGYLFLWSIYWLFKLLTHKDGMGYGDFKLLSLLGAWLGWQVLPVIILLSSVVGVIVGLTMIACKRLTREQPIPFGPYLATAGWLSLIWGDKLIHYYLKLIPSL